MKKLISKYKFSTIVFMACVISLAGGAAADTVLSTLVTPASPEDTSTIDQRVASRKSAYSSQLPASANASTASKCVLAQSALTDVRNQDTKASKARTQAYDDLAKQLSYLVDNLSAQGVNATELLNSQNQFVSHLNTYLNDAESYKAAMDDAINIDCQKDPAGFRASVLDARKWRAQLASDVATAKADEAPLRKALSDERQLLIKNPGHAPTGTVGTRAQ